MHIPRCSLVIAALPAAFALHALGGAAMVAQSPSALPMQSLPLCTADAAAPPAIAPGGPVASAAPGASSVAVTDELTIGAAASLRGALEAMAPTYTAETGISLVSTFDASSALRTQVEEGAPIDVFASADVANVERLVTAGMAYLPVAFACTQLTIIVPAGNPAGITSAADLARPGLKIIAAGEDVPITRYAVQLVENLGITDGYTANVVSKEDNVAAVRSKIEIGEGDAGIVYVTDVITSGDLVEQIPVPQEANVPATYAAAIVTGTDQPDESAAFLDHLTGPRGQAALASFGFLAAPADAMAGQGVTRSPSARR